MKNSPKRLLPSKMEWAIEVQALIPALGRPRQENDWEL